MALEVRFESFLNIVRTVFAAVPFADPEIEGDGAGSRGGRTGRRLQRRTRGSGRCEFITVGVSLPAAPPEPLRRGRAPSPDT